MTVLNVFILVDPGFTSQQTTQQTYLLFALSKRLRLDSAWILSIFITPMNLLYLLIIIYSVNYGVYRYTASNYVVSIST